MAEERRERRMLTTMPKPRVSECEPLCAVLWKIGLDIPGRQTAVLGLCGRLSVREEGQGDSCMDCTTVSKEKAV